MLFGRRRRWHGRVADLLPTFDLTLEEVGPMKALSALDLVYPKGFSEQEGALYLAYLCYPTFLRSDDQRAQKLADRIKAAEEAWMKSGRVNPKNVDAWREKASKWRSGDFSKSQ
ncbi:MAG: hypothetical protein AAFY80_15165 [Pseudomonadota bacterium]